MSSSSPSQPTRRGHAPSALGARNSARADVDVPVDWSSWYLTDEDDMGDSPAHRDIIHFLLSSLGTLARERGWNSAYWNSDTFFAWVRGEPLVRVSPDVYLLDDPPRPLPGSFQTWLPGHKPPRWAAEIVSDDWRKDYEDAPLKYAQLGAQELVIFDPEAAAGASRLRERAPLQVYRRGEGGDFVLVYKGEGPAASEELGAFLAVERDGSDVRLRLTRDPAGVDRILTAEETALAAEARARALEAEKMAAEARARALEAEVARLRGGG